MWIQHKKEKENLEKMIEHGGVTQKIGILLILSLITELVKRTQNSMFYRGCIKPTNLVLWGHPLHGFKIRYHGSKIGLFCSVRISVDRAFYMLFMQT